MVETPCVAPLCGAIRSLRYNFENCSDKGLVSAEGEEMETKVNVYGGVRCFLRITYNFEHII